MIKKVAIYTNMSNATSLFTTTSSFHKEIIISTKLSSEKKNQVHS